MNKILIYLNKTKIGFESALQKVRTTLLNDGFDCVVADDESAAAELLKSGITLAVCLGGDGTMLSIAVAAAQNKVPLLGINLGRLGYMTELETDEIPLLSSLKTNEFTVENRIMLSADVIRDGKKAASFTALNEILVCRGSVSRMIDLTLKCDSTSVAAYRADGIIAATPTGSTAYTMSAGGPIIDAKLKLICVCPICPHSFTGSRAIVFSPDSSLEISVSSQYNGDIYLTSDGREHTQIFYDDVVRISRSPLVTGLIKIKKNTFYETLYKKFNFGETI